MWDPEVCGLWMRISADPQIFLWTRMGRGSAKQTHLRTRIIRGSKATSIVCRTNLERKCQCTSSQQFENWSIFGHCSRLCTCKKACLTVWGPIGIVYWIMYVLSDPTCGRGLSADVKFVDPHTSDGISSWCKKSCSLHVGILHDMLQLGHSSTNTTIMFVAVVDSETRISILFARCPFSVFRYLLITT